MDVSSAWITLAALDFETIVQFYSQLLGQSPLLLGPGYAEFQVSTLRLGIFRPSADQVGEFAGRAGGVSFCLAVKDLAVAIERVKAIGGRVPGPILVQGHGREVYGYDPMGNRIILFEPLA